ncbi:heat-inducible transcriptional repressor HrcA [Paracoccus shanxieyensis]|uniref:Heat-inducible transcription repressor HrcA n=1 Tax=Paracoccus shanxieyensis TaxID=2675752 RepID=A0A6L6J6T4_9RHOB|nr:heat-inducible transcriptional repressor HrcA [Paracoccus shanxieyensis]MTH66374.1 heat-inducible transcriptional repressor HrcA [Paracoccus shanxieyensis]MTH89605.1 heat-inducible transcriptional repressor HrcA [Paracoccus shanxieyensis]
MPETALLSDLNDRSREVFRRVVESYLATGDPVGSRSLTRDMAVSAATIRNVMQDLEYLGLLDHPHVSAGRMPTQLGLRLFVDGLMEAGPVSASDREMIEETLGADRGDTGAMMDRVSMALSSLTQGASLVLMPKQEAPVRHIEFVSLAPDRALVVLVFADGRVENRVFTPPPGHTASSMREAANFLNAFAEGRTLGDLRHGISREIEASRQKLDQMAAALIASGLAMWDSDGSDPRLIVRGRANLLAHELADLDRVRVLFDDLERKRDIAEFLELAEQGDGVRIFIGSENKLFSLSGSSLVVSPYMNADRKIVGAVGVIGPTRLNYGRIVPIVDYTAQLVGRMISGRKG